MSARPYLAEDQAAVLAIVNADRLPGQPAADAAMLDQALRGHSAVDSGWWAELDTPRTDVVLNGRAVVGVVSYAVRPRDEAGVVLWLHGREEPAVVDVLLGRAGSALGVRTIHAFEFATALGLGLEGLPVRHRAVTHRAMTHAGFAGRDLWRYMHAPLPLPDRSRQPSFEVTVEGSTDPPGRRIVARLDGEAAGEATVGLPLQGVGVLWWIEVYPAQRGRGLGRRLLLAAAELLHSELGANEMVLFVDDDAPAGDPERDRGPANRLYDRCGLRQVDRLFSYTCGPLPS